MTPSDIRDELATLLDNLRKLEDAIEHQKSANVGYAPILHEMTEAWEALDRGVDALDEMIIGIT